MALSRVKNLELISEKDAAVLSLNPLTLHEGLDPYVFVFKPHTDKSVHSDYLLLGFELQQIFPKPEKEGDVNDIQKLISNLLPTEQIGILEKMTSIQYKVIDLLLVGYREKIDGELIEKNQEILEIIKENDVIGEFYNKITKLKTDITDKKKS